MAWAAQDLHHSQNGSPLDENCFGRNEPDMDKICVALLMPQAGFQMLHSRHLSSLHKQLDSIVLCKTDTQRTYLCSDISSAIVLCPFTISKIFGLCLQLKSEKLKNLLCITHCILFRDYSAWRWLLIGTIENLYNAILTISANSTVCT